MAEDRYANRAGITITESAAGVLTFQELVTGVGFGTKKGMLIDQIDYLMPNSTLALLVATGDRVNFGITISTGVTDLEDVTDLRILHSGFQEVRTFGTAGTALNVVQPHDYQFFPSLIHANIRIYLAVQAASLASPATIRARIYWRHIDLTDREVAELVQATLLQA